MEEPSGFPWVKILGFAAPAVLMIGALLFFLWPTPTALKSPDSSEEAKQVSAASRVIGGSHTNPSVPQPAANVEPPVALSTAPGTNAQPNVATTDPLNQLPMNPPPVDLPSVDQPRVFDPKSLARAKAAVPPRRRGNGALARLAPPRLGKGVEVTDAGTLPVPLSAPPPPEPVVPAAPAAVPDARESAGRVGGAFAQPVLIKTVWPIYPASAVQRKAQGMVRFQATIAKDGSVKNIQLVSGDPALNVAAKEAVLQWKYRPAILNGEPVEVTQTIVVKFNLSNP
jgi:TonB family protein